MGISRHATAHWEGDLKSGKGQLSTPQSGLLDKTRYGFNSRFGDEKGTNPEELIAAAHAGCFTMALSAKLGEAGFTPTSLDTEAKVDLSLEGGPQLSQIRLKVKAVVPGIDAAQFRAIADDAKQNCPVSKALSAVPAAGRQPHDVEVQVTTGQRYGGLPGRHPPGRRVRRWQRLLPLPSALPPASAITNQGCR